MVRQLNFHKIYYYIIVAILASLSLLNTCTNSNGGSLNAILEETVFILAFFNFFITGIKKNKIIFVVLIFMILLITKFNSFFIVPVLFSLAFVNYTPWDLIRGYNLANLFSLCMTVLLSILGFLPMRNYLDGVISLGYTNENTLGLFTLLISLFYTLEIIMYKSKMKFIRLKIIFIITFVFLNYFIIEDRTVIVVFLVFLLLCYVFKSKINFFVYLTKVLGCLCPILFTYISLFLVKHYDSSNFYFTLNKLLTNRLYMWNWYFERMPISLYPSNLKINLFDFWGTIDGSYVYLLFQSGVLVTIITCSLLVYSNYLLLKNNFNYLFCLLLSLEVCAFSEDILQLPLIVFVMCFALLSIYPNWVTKFNE